MLWFPVLVFCLVAGLPFADEWRRKAMGKSARADAPGNFAELSRGATHYRWSGPLRGPVAVCVHGLTTPSPVWEGIAEGLAGQGFRVLAYDLYGRGYSDRPPGRQDADFFCEQLEELLADQGVGQDFTLLGYSMGGAVAAEFAARNPDRIRQLVLIAAAGVVTEQGRFAALVRRVPLAGDWLMHAVFPRAHARACEAERALPSSVPDLPDIQLRELSFKGFLPAVLSSMRGILAHPQEAAHRALHRAGVPVLAVWGSEDVLVPVSAAGRLAEWNRSALQEVAEGAGHGLPYTHTDAVLQAINRSREIGSG